MWSLQPYLGDFFRKDIQRAFEHLHRGGDLMHALKQLRFLDRDETISWHDTITAPDAKKMVDLLFDNYQSKLKVNNVALLSVVRMLLIFAVLGLIAFALYGYWDIAQAVIT